MTDRLIKDMVVPNQYYDVRADVVLAHLFPEFSRSQLTKWLKDNSITVNHRPCKPKDKLQGGEYIHLNIVPQTHAQSYEAEPIPINIVDEDEQLIIINKPAGLVVHPGAGNPNRTLVNALLHHDPNLSALPRAGIIHRLDKDTTGLMIVAKTLQAQTHLIRQMQARDIQRQYLALVYGHIISGATIDTYFGRHPHNRLKMAVCHTGKQAITQYRVHKHYPNLTLLDVHLMTGRTHQIRVHLSHIHHPIVGDPLYTGRKYSLTQLSINQQEALLHFKRQALHARFLAFKHPCTEDMKRYEAPLPDDFQSLLNILDDTNDPLCC